MVLPVWGLPWARGIWWLKHQGADNGLLLLGKGVVVRWLEQTKEAQVALSSSLGLPVCLGTPQLQPQPQSQGAGGGGEEYRLKQTSVSKHTPELPQLCSWRSGWGQGVCAITRGSPLPLPPPLPHGQGQSSWKLQGREGPGSYLDLGRVAGPGLSMQGGLHL